VSATTTAECESCDPIDPTGAIYIDSSDLLIAESYPVQISLHFAGSVPTPCHSLKYSYQIGTDTDRFRIDIVAWSESDPGVVCIQVLDPFEINIPIPMDGAANGTYNVWLNGNLIGEFSYPA
jgi:hypothetical protein